VQATQGTSWSPNAMSRDKAQTQTSSEGSNSVSVDYGTGANFTSCVVAREVGTRHTRYKVIVEEQVLAPPLTSYMGD